MNLKHMIGVNAIPNISLVKSGKNTFSKSGETIELETSFVSPICKVTSKTSHISSTNT